METRKRLRRSSNPADAFTNAGHAAKSVLVLNTVAPSRQGAEVFELGEFIPSVYHFNMLADDVRMTAFKEAISLTVGTGCRVLELGGGTGVLSFFAAKAGAQVLCIERNPELVEQARTILRANLAGQVKVIKADAFDYFPPHRVDVVLCEMIHVGMLRERQLQVIESFKARYLKEFGPPIPLFIPEAFFQAIQPVQHCFDFHGYVVSAPCFQDPSILHSRTQALGDPIIYHSGTYQHDFSLDCSWSGSLTMTQSGDFNAVRFITKNVLAVLENEQRTVDWTSQYLIVPIDLPMPVFNGQTVPLHFEYKAGDPIRALKPQVGLRS
jgi:predicted RNA methylase